MRFSPLVLFLLSPLAACDGLNPSPPEEECKLSIRGLTGTQWVMLEALPDGTNRENPRARMRFYQGDEGLKVDYSVGSPYEMHTYDCQISPRGISCAEEPKLVDWCLAFEAHKEGSCSAAKLREVGGSGLDDTEVIVAIREARRQYAEMAERAKENPEMLQRFRNANNFLGNKLQGLLDVRVNRDRCRLTITDNYMTIHNGRKIVDSNPVGTNAFVQEKANNLLFENCMEGAKFLALDSEAPPTDEDLKTIDPRRQFTSDDTIYYHYIGFKHIEAEEGCTYTADTWAQWLPKEEGVTLETIDCDFTVPDINDPEKGRKLSRCVSWTASHQWSDTSPLKLVADDETAPRAFFAMTRYKTCGDGEKEKLDTICAAARVMGM